jgi:hypothetical protein
VFQAVPLALVIIAATALLRTHEQREREWLADPVLTPVVAPPIEQVREQDRILAEMSVVRAEMDRALELVKSADPETRAKGTREFSAAQERFTALHGEFEGLPVKYARPAGQTGNTTGTK